MPVWKFIASFLINMHYCNYTEPYGSEKVTYDGSDDHADKLDPWFTAVVDYQSGNDCHYDKSDDISAGASQKNAQPPGEPRKYRQADDAHKQLEHDRQRSPFSAKDAYRDKYAEGLQGEGDYRGNGDPRTDRHQNGKQGDIRHVNGFPLS